MNLTLVIVWAVLTISLVVFELATVQFVAVWFAAGALVAFIASLFGVSVPISIVIFILVSIILLLCTRSFVKRVLNEKKTPTNADSIIGETCIVTEKINNIEGTGRVIHNGLNWTARSLNCDVFFEVNAHCKIVAIEGVKVIVTAV